MRSGARSLIAVTVVGSLLLACSGDGSGPAPSPTEQETSPASTTPTPEPTDESPGPIFGPCCAGFELEPGRYTSPSWFDPPFEIDIPDGWKGVADAREGLLLLGTEVNDIRHLRDYLGIFAVDPSVDLVHELGRTPKLRVGRPRPVSVAGLSGRALNARAEPNPSQSGDQEIAEGGIPIPAVDRLVPGFWFSESPEAGFRFLLLEAEGVTLFVYIEAASQGFEAFVRSSQELLDSLRLA